MNIVVLGDPKPKGSMRGFYSQKRRRVFMTNDNPNTNDWERRVSTEAQKVRDMRREWDMASARSIIMEFIMSRPKSLPKRVIDDIKRPDLDKLIRAVLDPLTGICYDDDSQIIEIQAHKRYADAGEATGVEIEIEEGEGDG